MYEVDNSYLEDEVRDGFYIPSMIKRAWAAELSILSELDRICDKYNIRYFADWGTLLGAVRHRGFVPWDDDIDVCMFRDDLEKLQAVADDELPEGFRLFSFENNDYSWKFVVNLVNTERMTFTPEYLKSHYNFPYMATIDIFVIDNLSDDEEYEERRREKVKRLLYVADNSDLDNIELRRQRYREVLSVLTEKKGEDTENVCQMIPWGVYHKLQFPRDYYDEAIKVPFENTVISVPKRYDMLLKYKFGNYANIVMGTSEHGYPYYRAQKESLGLSEDEDYVPHYKFDRRVLEAGQLSVLVENQDKEKVLFLPFKGNYWDTLKPFYELECSKENADVFVVPLPYFYKEYDGTLMDEPQYDLETYPEDLPGYLYEEIDLESMYFDRIYIQNPYDEYNMCMSVPREYYASNLRKLTDKLIYIPWFKTSDFEADNFPQNYNMQYYCTVPGVVLSDEVYVSSEKIRDRYVDKLTAFGGEDTRAIWEEKVLVTPFRDEDLVSDALLIYFSPSTILEYKDKMLGKINRCVEIFYENSKKLRFIWHLNQYELEIIKEKDALIYDELMNIVSNLSDVVTIDYDMSEAELLKKCKAYYGDGSYLSKAFTIAKKPVMIEAPEI